MKATLEFYRNLLDNLFDGVYIVDLERKIIYWNRGAERITGYRGDEVIGSHCWDNILMHVDERGIQLCNQGCPLLEVMSSGSPLTAEVYLSHKDGHRVPVQVRAAPFMNSRGKIFVAVEIFSDNTDKVTALHMVEDLQAKVFLDPLTGLANRRYVEMNIQGKFDEMSRYGWPFGVIMMDIDHFKDVNDGFGHDMGDEALKMVARTLIHNSRSSDIVGRWGGEEFIAIITNADVQRVGSIAERYRSMIELSGLPVGEATLRLTISVGATVAVQGDSMASVIKRADTLLYASKASGRNRVTAG